MAAGDGKRETERLERGRSRKTRLITGERRTWRRGRGRAGTKQRQNRSKHHHHRAWGGFLFEHPPPRSSALLIRLNVATDLTRTHTRDSLISVPIISLMQPERERERGSDLERYSKFSLHLREVSRSNI